LFENLDVVEGPEGVVEGTWVVSDVVNTVSFATALLSEGVASPVTAVSQVDDDLLSTEVRSWAVSSKLELARWLAPCSRIRVAAMDITWNSISGEMIDGDFRASPEGSVDTTSLAVETTTEGGTSTNDTASSVGILAWSIDITVTGRTSILSRGPVTSELR